jgi:CheY-like chemotaxis protein
MMTRQLMLEQAGHTVLTASDEADVASACELYQFDVAVIGQASSAAIKRLMASLVRQHCKGVTILELYAPHKGKAIPDADAWLEVPADVPEQLAQRVGDLARRSKRRAV